MMIKGALFDLDGVIADTSVYHFQAWRDLVAKHFNASLPDDLEAKTKGVSRADSLRIILDYLGKTVDQVTFEALADEKNTAYIKLLDDLTPANISPGITDFITSLKAQNIKLALASASLNGPYILEKLALSDVFDAVANPAEVTSGKPAPDIFIAAAQALNLEPQDCIGVEDAIAGVTAINASGAFSVAVGDASDLSHAKLHFPSTAELNLTTIQKAFEVAR